MSENRQHVGGLSDAITDDGVTPRQRLLKVAKPTGRAFTGRSDSGNGAVCPVNPEHGKMWTLVKGDWCPHVDHSSGKVLQ